MTAIQVDGLRKAYGPHEVLTGVDLRVETGEIVGILGPNGSGKTTTVECIGGLRTRDGGTILVDGLDPAREPARLRHVLGMQLQQCRLPARATVAELLALFASFYPAPRPQTDLLERFGLTGCAGTRFEQLSGGQQQRLSVAIALVGDPRIAILDELTTGLDPAARRDIWAYLSGLREDGVTMLLVTHSMEEAAHLCDRVVVLTDGRIVGQGSPAQLTAAGDEQETSFVPIGAPLDLDLLSALPGVRAVARAGERVVVTGDADSPQAVLRLLLDHGVRAGAMRVTQPSLDDAYLRLTGHPTRQENR